MQTLVVLAVGRSDLQWLAMSDGQPVRVGLAGRREHLALLRLSPQWRWCEDPRVAHWPEVSPGPGAPGVAAAMPAGQPLLLYAPKVAPWLAVALGEESHLTAGTECMVLHTERDENAPFAAAEPVAAAPLIARWLSSAPWCWQAQVVRWLEGHEDASRPDDQRQAASRLLQALVSARRRGCQRVLLLDTGGLPALKQMARLLCQTVFGADRVERVLLGRAPAAPAVQVTAGAGFRPLTGDELLQCLASCAEGSGPGCAPVALEGPLEGELRLRTMVADQIRRGHLAALPGMLPQRNAGPRPGWSDALVAALAWSSDGQPAESCLAWPGGPLPGALIDGPERTRPPIAWTLAVRIECALQAGAVAEALTQTVEWFECLLAQAIVAEVNRWLDCDGLAQVADGGVEGLDTSDREEIVRRLDANLPRLEADGCCWGMSRPDGRPVTMLALPRLSRTPGTWRLLVRRDNRDAVAAWAGLLPGPLGAALRSLHDALRTERRVPQAGNLRFSAYQLRNLKAHQGLSQALGAQAACCVTTVLAETGLWSAGDRSQPPGAHFLAQALPARVLALLGMPAAAQQFCDWVAALERLVREWPLDKVESETHEV